MFAHLRLARISLLCMLCLFPLSLASGQTHGIAPSVTSFGFGGSSNPTPGIPASVTSVGPNGFVGTGCCFGPLIVPPNGVGFDGPRFDRGRFDRDSFNHGRRDGHRLHDHLRLPGVLVPVYVPYPVAYGEDEAVEEDAGGADIDYSHMDYSHMDYSHRAVGPDGPPSWRRDGASRQTGLRGRPDEVAASVPRESTSSAASDPAVPVAAQPSTVLVYKDGHKAEVENYAIVGNTLFDFSGSLSHKIPLADLDLPATQKANDERGVEFQVPARNQ